MSDKSEIEVIRARDAAWSIQNCVTEHGSSDRRALLTHVDALEARIAQLEGALHEIQFGELQCDYCQENMRIARAALAGSTKEPTDE